jgi:hypothetical protein
VPVVKAARLVRNQLRGEARRGRRLWRDAADRQHLRTTAAQVVVGPHPAATVMVHFADGDPDRSLYQLRQWFEPLAELHRTTPVAITVRSATMARAIAAETALPVAYLRKTIDIERYMVATDPRLVLYVNHWEPNFQLMRYGRALHVFISHGESEKVYMASGQLRAYDFAFVAGEAAIDRIRAHVPNYDPVARTRRIGRPQLDFLPPDRSAGATPITVLYAPTYEGDRPSMAYGSVQSHGLAVVDSLLAAGYRVVYRPHPLTGTITPDAAAANRAIHERLTAANAALPPGRQPHVLGARGPLGEQMAESAVAIVDNSAMAFDWLVTGKPIVVTVPTTAAQTGLRSSFLDACYRLTAQEAPQAGDVVARALDDDTLGAQRAFWIARHFGDVTPGASLRRFLEATGELVAFGAEQVRRTEQAAAELAARPLGPGIG